MISRNLAVGLAVLASVVSSIGTAADSAQGANDTANVQSVDEARHWPERIEGYQPGETPHPWLYMRDCYEDKGSNDGKFNTWDWDSLIATAASPIIFVGNIVKMPFDAAINPPWRTEHDRGGMRVTQPDYACAAEPSGMADKNGWGDAMGNSSGAFSISQTSLLAIICPKKAAALETFAGREIRRYVYLRTGNLATVRATDGVSGSGVVIAVGTKQSDIVRKIVKGDRVTAGAVGSLQNQQYLIKSVCDPGRVVVLIAGGDEVGVLYGAYRFIEEMGVRFYLHGDVIPDQKETVAFDRIDIMGKPLFALRGVLPFHDFPEGPDWWSRDKYKAVVGQLPKMGMNFIGLHAYPGEMTVWIGLAEDCNADGTVKYSAGGKWYSTLDDRYVSYGCYAPGTTDDYHCGGGLAFETGSYGPEVMQGQFPQPTDPQACCELSNRVGAMLNDVFSTAKKLGVKTCVGTESPLTVPDLVKTSLIEAKKTGQDRLKEKGLNPDDPETIEKLYEGIFTRISRTHSLDYYWIWTPESWTWETVKDNQIEATQRDILAAVEAKQKVNAKFSLATAGWVLGPPQEPAKFDNVLPKDVAFSCISRHTGQDPVEPGFAKVAGRSKWAIPWLEDDPAMIMPQLYVGRMRKDAVDALVYGCDGLMGIHWRTRVMGPNVSALAKAGWDQTGWMKPESMVQRVDGKATPLRNLPADDFYQDWATHQFGPQAGGKLGSMFSALDGKLPRPCEWEKGPGVIKINDKTTPEQELAKYGFVDELAAIRGQVVGAGNLERFDWWLNQFRYMRSAAQLGCTRGQLDNVMADIEKLFDEAQKRQLAAEKALPLRLAMTAQFESLYDYLLATLNDSAEMGQITNIEQQHLVRMQYLTLYDNRLQKILGAELPAEASLRKDYRGPLRVTIEALRTQLQSGENLHLKVIILSEANVSIANLMWRPLGRGEYNQIPLEHVARGVYRVTLPAKALKQAKADDFEYYVEVNNGRETVKFPATAPEINQTVVVMSL